MFVVGIALTIVLKNSIMSTLLLSPVVLAFSTVFTSAMSRGGGGWGRASDSPLQEPGFESCAVVLKPRASFFTLHCSSSLSCINEYLAIDSGGYVCEQPSRINCSIWLDASLIQHVLDSIY